MAIFTNKDLREKILYSDAYLYIAQHRKSKSIVFTGHSFTSWPKLFGKYPDVAKLIDEFSNMSIPNDNTLINRDIYKKLIYIKIENEKSKNAIIKKFLEVLNGKVDSKVLYALEVLEKIDEYEEKKPDDFVQIYRQYESFWNVCIASLGDNFSKVQSVKDMDEKIVKRMKNNIENKPNSFATPEQQTRLSAALTAGSKYSIACKNDCTLLLSQLNAQIETNTK